MEPMSWRKSTWSGDSGGQCVEVGTLTDAIAVRDSKDPDGPRLVVSGSAFRALAQTIKAGELDI